VKWNFVDAFYFSGILSLDRNLEDPILQKKLNSDKGDEFMCVVTTAQVADKWHVVAFTAHSARGDIESFNQMEAADQKAQRIVNENPGCFYIPAKCNKMFAVAQGASRKDGHHYLTRVVVLPKKFNEKGEGTDANVLTECRENDKLNTRFFAKSTDEANGLAKKMVKDYLFPFVPGFFESVRSTLKFIQRPLATAAVGEENKESEEEDSASKIGFQLTFGLMGPFKNPIDIKEKEWNLVEIKNPIISRHLAQLKLNEINPSHKFELLYASMAPEAEKLDQYILRSLEAEERIYDPLLYKELAECIQKNEKERQKIPLDEIRWIARPKA